jgi:hypothetical protein
MPSTVLQSTKQPWVHLLIHSDQQKAEPLLSLPSGFLLKVIPGAKCKTKAGLLSEFARVLLFPEYFGHNWDALEDDYETFVEILEEAGEAWSGHHEEANGAGIPFHTVLAVSERHKGKRRNWLVPPLSLESKANKSTGRKASGSRGQ